MRSSIQIYHGTARHSLLVDAYSEYQRHATLVSHPAFSHLVNELSISKLVCAKQMHSDQGIVITAENKDSITSFVHEGDFIITDQLDIAIGVLTADCLPIILYDPAHQAIGIVHAGWKGSAQQVVIKAIIAMHKQYSTQVADLKVYLGASARDCCYQVSSEFSSSIPHIFGWERTIIKRGEDFYFNNTLYTQLQLAAIGVPIDAVNKEYNNCTICNHSYASHRRSPEPQYRQLTAVVLKKSR